MQIYTFFVKQANDKQQNRLSANRYNDAQAI